MPASVDPTMGFYHWGRGIPGIADAKLLPHNQRKGLFRRKQTKTIRDPRAPRPEAAFDVRCIPAVVLALRHQFGISNQPSRHDHEHHGQSSEG